MKPKMTLLTIRGILTTLLLLNCSANLLTAQSKDNKPLGVSEQFVFALTGDTAYPLIGLHSDGSVMCASFYQRSGIIKKLLYRRSDTSEVFYLKFDTTGRPLVAVYGNQMMIFGPPSGEKCSIVLAPEYGEARLLTGIEIPPMPHNLNGSSQHPGPSPLYLNPEEPGLSDYLGYAASAAGYAACGVAMFTASPFGLPCAAALVDAASRNIPGEYKKTKAAFELASSLLNLAGFKGPLGALDKWQAVLGTLQKSSEGIEIWLNEYNQRQRYQKLMNDFFPPAPIYTEYEKGSPKKDAQIVMTDFETIIALANEGNGKIDAIKKKNDELSIGITAANAKEISDKMNANKEVISATKKEYCEKIKTVAAKGTINYGFLKADALPYSIRDIKLSSATWNSSLYLQLVISFSAGTIKKPRPYSDPPTTMTLCMREMWLTPITADNKTLPERMLSIGKEMRTNGKVEMGLNLEQFIQVRSFQFNTREFREEYY